MNIKNESIVNTNIVSRHSVILSILLLACSSPEFITYKENKWIHYYANK